MAKADDIFFFTDLTVESSPENHMFTHSIEQSSNTNACNSILILLSLDRYPLICSHLHVIATLKWVWLHLSGANFYYIDFTSQSMKQIF